MRARKALIVGGAAGLLGIVAISLIVLTGSGRAQADPNAPNIVVIMTDDQNAGTVNRRTMPATARLLQRGGTDFTEAVVTTPQCCPSRAAFFSGQYGHNNGVLSNSDGYPGLVDDGSVLPVWLSRAGYTTAHVGRFLKDYGQDPEVDKAADPPPGWDEWAGMRGVRYFDYSISYDGEMAQYGRKPSDYSTTVFTREAVGVVREHAPDEAPLFLSIAYVAPHKERAFHRESYCDGAVGPAPRDRHRFLAEPLPDKPNIAEQDVSDKPDFIRNGSRLEDKRAKTVRAYRCSLAALREVDRGVRRVYRAFMDAGEAEDTVFIFTSDNGRFAGEHGLPGGKSFPYEESIRVPLLMRLPERLGGADAPSNVDDLVANIDLAPTILDLARARPCVDGECRLLDGRSLMPLVDGRGRGWSRDRTVLIELQEPPETGQTRLPCAYVGARTTRDFYVHYTEVRDPETGICRREDVFEYYDLVGDPGQLDNLASDPTPTVAFRRNELARRLTLLRDCEGLPGRELVAGSHPCE